MAVKKRVTMKDIAGKLGLSINAVSLALNDRAGVGDDTRRLVLDTAEAMGYLDQSVKYIQTYSNKNICVLMKYRFFRDFRFYGRILLGIEEEAKKSGYDVFINSYENEGTVPSCVENKKVSGIIVVGKLSDGYLRQLKGYGIPVVLADHTSLAEATDSIMSDNKLGTFKMTAYLIENGYKKIGYFGDARYTPSTIERFQGYHEAMLQYLDIGGYEESMDYVLKYSSIGAVEEKVIGQDMDGLFEMFLQIEEKPDVLLCSNDELAILLMKVLQKNGYKIPDDISIVGFDDIELSRMVLPALTTIHVSKKLMGQKAVDRLLYRISHPKDGVEKLVLNVEIIERDSVNRQF